MDNSSFVPMISKDVFNKEIQMCKNLNKMNAECNWGKCNQCGVLPLLIKLYEGKLLENSSEINAFKEEIFN